MPHALIIHEAADYPAWRNLRRRRRHPARGLRAALPRLRYVHSSAWTSLADARSFFGSSRPRRLRDQAGVRAPEFICLQELEAGTP